MTGSNGFTINFNKLLHAEMVKTAVYFGNIQYKTDENNPKLSLQCLCMDVLLKTCKIQIQHLKTPSVCTITCIFCAALARETLVLLLTETS